MSIIKSFSVGKGDMFYINHNSDSFTVIDCCLSDDNLNDILKEIKEKSHSKGINRFISTHPDDDHIKGLREFKNKIGISNFYCVENNATKENGQDDFELYCELRDSDKVFYLEKGCSRKWLNDGDEGRKGAGINCKWPLVSNTYYIEALQQAKNGESPNNISPIITYSIENSAKVMWMGDLETTFIDNIKDSIRWENVDILFAPHHGRDSGKVSNDILQKLSPKIIVIGEADSTDLNYYNGYNTITQNSAGDIIFECVENKVHVFVSRDSYSVNFLDNESETNRYGKYIGTLNL